MKYLYVILFFLSVSNLAAAGSFRDVYILQSTDVHSTVFGERGWLKEAEIIHQQIAKLGKERVLLIDCGDTLQGAFSGMITKGKIGVLMLNYLNYDAWIPGNHDFDFGLETFLDRAEAINADCIIANSKMLSKKFASWKIYQKNGLKIAVIGMTFPKTYTMIWGKHIKSVGFYGIEKTLDIIMPDIMKKKPDVIILAMHRWLFSTKRLGGISFSRIYEKYPQIDLFLGGHVHNSVEGEKINRGGYAVVAGAHSESLAKVHIRYDTVNMQIVDIDSELLKVDVSVLENKLLSKKLTSLRDFVEKEASTPVALLTDSLPLEKMEALLGKAIYSKMGADFSLISLPSYINTLPEGIVHKIDLFKIEPYEDEIILVDVTLKDIKEIIKEQLSMQKYHFVLCSYIKQMLFCLKNENEINKSLSNMPNKRYKLAVFSFFAAGAENRLPVLKKIADESSGKAVTTGIKVRDMLTDIIKDTFPLKK